MRVNKAILKVSICTCHREYVLRLDETFEKYRFRVIVLEELLHLRWEFVGAVAPDSVYTHRLGESDEVRVSHLGMRVPCVIEQIYVST